MKNYKDLNDYEIIYMIGENDEIARKMMFDKYSPIIKKEAANLYKYAKKVGLDISDLEQEGYYALTLSMRKYDPNKDVLFYTYAIAAIKRKMGNLIRISSANKHIALNESISLDKSITEDDANLFSFVEDPKSIKPLDAIVSKELIDDIENCLYGLSLDYASVLELKLNGFKTGEIASLLSITKYSVTSILSRIKKKIDLKIEN